MWLRPDGSPYVPGPKPDPEPGPKVIDLAALPAWPEGLPPPDPGDAAERISDYVGLGIEPSWPSQGRRRAG